MSSLQFISSRHCSAGNPRMASLCTQEKIQTPSRDWQGAPCSSPCSVSSLVLHSSSPLRSAGATEPTVGSANRFSSSPLPCLCLCHIFTCWLHPISQVSVHMPAAQSSEGPSATVLCGNLPVVIFVLLWLHCPSLVHSYPSKMILYLLADCLIGI